MATEGDLSLMYKDLPAWFALCLRLRALVGRTLRAVFNPVSGALENRYSVIDAQAVTLVDVSCDKMYKTIHRRRSVPASQ